MSPFLTRWAPLVFTILAVVLAVGAQTRLAPPDPKVLPGLALAVGGALCLLFARQIAQSTSTKAPSPEALPAPETSPGPRLRRPTIRLDGAGWRWVATGAATLMAASVLWTLRNEAPRDSYLVPLLTWALALALMAGAWLGEPLLDRARWQRLGRWLRAHRIEVALLGGIVALSMVLRLWNLRLAPFTFGGDEGSIGLDVGRVLSGELRNPFALAFGPLPTLSYFGRAALAGLFGLSDWSVRLFDASFGILAIPALYLLARQLFRAPVALAASGLLATYHFHLHYSRTAEAVGIDTFFLPATLAAIVYGLRQGHKAVPPTWPWVVAGLLGGLSQYIYTGSRLLPLFVGIFLIYLFLLARHQVMGQAQHIALMALTFLIVAGPIFLYAFQHPDDFNARINQVGVIQSGWLTREQEIRGEGAGPILWDQFRRALFGFAFFGDTSTTYGPGGPLASAGMALFLYLGLGVATWRALTTPRYALVAGWFWAVLLTGGMLTVNPPTSNRLSSLTPVVALLAAIGLSLAVRLLVLAWRPRRPRHWRAALLALVVLGLMAYDANFYFRNYLPSHRFAGGEALAATMIGRDLAARSPAPALYLFGAPRLYSGFSSLAFLAPEVQAFDITEPVSDPAVVQGLVVPGKDAAFVFLPERFGELTIVSSAFPDGEVSEVRSPDGKNVMYYLYFVRQS